MGALKKKHFLHGNYFFLKKRALNLIIVLIMIVLTCLGVIFCLKDSSNQRSGTFLDENHRFPKDTRNILSSSNDLRIEKGLKHIPQQNTKTEKKSKLYSKRGWEICWYDEFDGKEIKEEYWTLQQGGDIWGNNELQYYTNNFANCFVENGNLIITGQKEDFNGKKYTSARIVTKGKVNFSYGKIEIRAKLPRGRGLLPAIWLMPTNNLYNEQKKNGEIDIIEMLSSNPKVVYGVAHYITKTRIKSSTKYYVGMDLSKDFHLFSLEWDKRELKWLIDNKVFFTLDLKKTFRGDFNPFTKDFYLIMNLAIGGNWPGRDIAEEALPAVMQIDYVRYYKKSS